MGKDDDDLKGEKASLRHIFENIRDEVEDEEEQKLIFESTTDLILNVVMEASKNFHEKYRNLDLEQVMKNVYMLVMDQTMENPYEVKKNPIEYHCFRFFYMKLLKLLMDSIEVDYEEGTVMVTQFFENNGERLKNYLHDSVNRVIKEVMAAESDTIKIKGFAFEEDN